MSQEPIISFNNVSKTYKRDLFKSSSKALDHLTFSVKTGESFGIVGLNGAGKSTALKILLGFISQDEGQVQINDLHPQNSICHDIIGYLPETPCLYDQLSIVDHLLFVGRVAGFDKSKIKDRIESLLCLVKLESNANTPIRQYSKGMTQRAALAYALFHEPRILVLDEPMSGLDPLGRQLVVDIIGDYNRMGNTVLFCSHILTDVERICDRIGVMNSGKLTKIINPGNLPVASGNLLNKAKSPLESFFLETVSNGNVK